MRLVASRRALAATLWASLPVLAASLPAAAQSWRATPSVGASATFSDNVGLLPEAQAQAGWIFDLAPGLRVEHLSPRARVFADYRIHGLSYTTDSPADETQQYLDANAHWKAIGNFLTVDARANITQQPRSPFAGAVAPDAATSSPNRGETRVFELSPAVGGYLGSLALYQLRFTATEADATEVGLPRTRSASWIGRVRSASPSAVIGWSLEAEQLRVRNDLVGDLEDARVRGLVYVAVIPTVRLSLSYGREETDFLGGERRRDDTPGAGIDWVPSERTQLSAAWEKRFFGDGHRLFLAHRTPLTAWRVNGAREVSVLPNQLAMANLRSVSTLLSDLLSSAQPDPVQRAAAVRARMEESFLPETSALTNGLLSAQPFLLKSIEGSGALAGRRNTFTVALARREQVGIRELGAVSEDVRREGISATWAYRLTPLTTITVTGSYLRTEGLDDAGLRTTDRALTALYATRLGPDTTFSVGARRAEVESTAVPGYAENAVVVVLRTRI